MESAGGAGPPPEPCSEGGPCPRSCFSSNVTKPQMEGMKADDWSSEWADKKCPTKNERCILVVTLSNSKQSASKVSSFRGCESDMHVECDNMHSIEPGAWRVDNKWYSCCTNDKCNSPRIQLSITMYLSVINQMANSTGLAFEIRVEGENSFVFVFGTVSKENPENLDFNKQFWTLADYGDLLAIGDAQARQPFVTREFVLKHTDPLIIFEEYLHRNSDPNAASNVIKLPLKQQIDKPEFLRWLNSLPTLDDSRECRECKQNCVKNKPKDEWHKCVRDECGQLSKFAQPNTYYMNCA